MMIKKLIFSIFIVFLGFGNLKENDVVDITNNLLKAHVLYNKLDENIIQRSLINFISMLDPSKEYFLKKDIEKWLFAKKEILKKIKENFKKEDFSDFKEIHQKMVFAIHRKRNMPIEAKEFKSVDNEELRDLDWSESLKELQERICKINYFRKKISLKLKNPQKIIKLAEKRRSHREAKILNANNNFIFNYILKSIAFSLDSHSNYFTEKEAKQFIMEAQQKFSGIGAILQDNLNGFEILRVLENGAAKEKLKVKDLIIAVDKKPIIEMDIMQAVELIRGKKGTTVTLGIIREDKKIDVDIIRKEIVLKENRIQKEKIPFANSIIGYIKLFSFYDDSNNSSSKDIKKILEEFKKNSLKGLILDLRDNSGGLLSEAIKVTGLFITKGIIASIKDNQTIRHLRDTSGKMEFNGPIIILTNKTSASASEIVSQSLQDYKRAILVGDNKTFGKGSFQTISWNNSKISPKGEYKITRGTYYCVSGKSPQLVGVKPNIEIAGILSKIEVGEEFSKYPLKTANIASNFDDDLSDIPIFERNKISAFYKHNLQKPQNTYFKYLDQLQKNSKKRMDKNKLYQEFIKEKDVNKKPWLDFQKIEAINIMKDLIYFLTQN